MMMSASLIVDNLCAIINVVFTLHYLSEGLLYPYLGEYVNVARRLVKDKHRRVGKHCACDCEELTLTGGKICAAGFYLSCVTVGQNAL